MSANRIHLELFFQLRKPSQMFYAKQSIGGTKLLRQTKRTSITIKPKIN